MSRTFSSRKPSSLPPPKAIATSCAKKKLSPRSPLQDLNRVSSSSNSSYASSSVSTEAPKGCLRFLSSSAFKTPAAHRPKSLSKTPNSVPDAFGPKQTKSKSSKENLSKGNNAELQTKKLGSNKARTSRKNTPCLYQWQSGKKSGSRTGQKSKPCSVLTENGKSLARLPPEFEELKGKEGSRLEINDNGGEQSQPETCHNDVNLTPLSKKVRGLCLDSTVHDDVEENPNASISITPPIHNSLSPEIQCGSSLVSTTTPACYGAGYVVSGITDKRKCRPRGILTVDENCSGFGKTPANSFDDDQKTLGEVDDNVSPSFLLPFPTEALVQWLSSPRNKGKKVLSPKSDSEVNQSQGLSESAILSSSTSPSCSSKSFWNISDSSDLSGAAYRIRRKVNSSMSPSGVSEFQLPFNSMLSPSYPSTLFSPNSILSCREGSSEKGKSYQYNPIDDNSPFSQNSFGSRNVIQTPNSDSSSDLCVALSLVHADNRETNRAPNSISEVFISEDFHLNSSAALEDSVNSSFQFDCLPVPCESIDLSKLPKFSDDQKNPWLSGSTIENASQSQMRISWREGSIMSQHCDLDEFDCCRCLSDEEELVNDSSSKRLSAPRVDVGVDGSKKLNSDVVISETKDGELEIEGSSKETFPALISYSGSESISTDGGGLVASKDGSEWSQCYKNNFYDE